MKLTPIILIAILWPKLLWPQAGSAASIKGRVLNEDNSGGINSAVVTTILVLDSTIRYSAFTDLSGSFYIPNVLPGNYELYIRHVGYQVKVIRFVINNKTPGQLDIGRIDMKRIPLQLKEIEIIQNKLVLKVRKDTIEYSASYYPTKETDAMRELLKKLPGVEFGSDGTITVNGQVVKQILVDGRPFFGNDTRMATDNLLSGIIKTIQVIDRKQDAKEFGSGNSGEMEKVINITLKDSQYGKIAGLVGAGGGPDGKFLGKAKLNRFGTKRQISFIASTDNINGLDEYGAMQKGENTVWYTGINFNQELNAKVNFSGSYYIEEVKSKVATNSLRQNILPGSEIFYDQSSVLNDKKYTQNAEAGFTFKPDSLSTLQLVSRLTSSNKSSSHSNIYETTQSGHQLNSGVTDNSSDFRSMYLFNGITYTRYFKKPGQNLKIDFGSVFSRNPGLQGNHSLIRYDSQTDPAKYDTLDQQRRTVDESPVMQFSIGYSQPLYSSLFLNLEYTYNRSKIKSSRWVNNLDRTERSYSVLVDSLSGEVNSKITVNKTFLGFKIVKPVFDLSLGASILMYNQSAGDSKDQSFYRKRFNNFSPTMDFNLKIGSGAFFHFTYDIRILPPAPDQLIQLPDNSNPLYIRKGNPELLPSLTHYFNADYRRINTRNGSNLLATAFLGLVNSQLVDASSIDSVGKQYSVPMNTNDAWFTGGFLSLSWPLKKEGMSIGTNNSLSLAKDYSYINMKWNGITRFNANQRVFYNYSVKDKLDVSLAVSIAYSFAGYTLQPESRTEYWDYNFSLDGKLRLFWGVDLATNSKYYLATGRGQEYNSDRLIINLAASKSVFNNKNGLIRVQVFDLLNRNFSYIRNIGAGYIEDVRTNSLRRVVMLGFVYYLNKSSDLVKR